MRTSPIVLVKFQSAVRETAILLMNEKFGGPNLAFDREGLTFVKVKAKVSVEIMRPWLECATEVLLIENYTLEEV